MHYTRRRGLGFAPVLAAAAAGSGPGAPIVLAVGGLISLLPVLLSQIGKGRKEADAIVPTQNQIGTILEQINGAMSMVDVATLQSWIELLRETGQKWLDFLGDPAFKDGRASQQAANTIMPLIDGSAGYAWPPPMSPSQYHAGPAGGGEDGTIGSLQRRIIELGGVPASGAIPQQGPGMGLRLVTPYSGHSPLPQAGTIPPIYRPMNLQAGFFPTGGGSDMTMVVLGGIALYLLYTRFK